MGADHEREGCGKLMSARLRQKLGVGMAFEVEVGSGRGGSVNKDNGRCRGTRGAAAGVRAGSRQGHVGNSERDGARVYDADGGISGGERSARSDPFANLRMTSARRDASSLALHQTSAEVISHILQQHHRSLLVCRCIRRNACMQHSEHLREATQPATRTTILASTCRLYHPR